MTSSLRSRAIPIAVMVLLAFPAFGQEGGWTFTGSMSHARRDHTATLLDDGRVLIVGGTGLDREAEIYDPVTGVFGQAGETVLHHRQGTTATRLVDGRVLIVGGFIPSGAEIFTPGPDTFGLTGAVVANDRSHHTATLLLTGKVLIAGGQADGIPGPQSLNSAEIYDPATGAFTPTGNLLTDRSGHSATLLPGGNVLVAGGIRTTVPGYGNCLDSAEIYDPNTRTFTSVGSMSIGRCSPRAPFLSHGKVLILGGGSASADLFDPATRLFSPPTSLTINRNVPTVTLLPDGRVIVAGGVISPAVAGESPTTLRSTEIYDPETNTFIPAPGMNHPRQQHTATLLKDGRVLVAGGYDFVFLTDRDSAELLAVNSLNSGFAAPIILEQPQSQTAVAGTNATFSVVVSDTFPFSYQWHFNGTPLAGATTKTASLTMTNVQPGDAGDYTVVVSNAAGSATSQKATLTVIGPPVITQQPQSQLVTPPADITLEVRVSGEGPVSYQWRKNGVKIEGATNDTLVVQVRAAGDGATYTVLVANEAGTATSDLAGVVVFQPVAVAPSITRQPGDLTATAGGTAPFNVEATGTPPLAYQWKKNDTNIPNATNTTLMLNSVSLTDNGARFTVTVSNSVNAVTSRVAVLTVCPAIEVVTINGQSGPWDKSLNLSFAYAHDDPIPQSPTAVPVSPGERILVSDASGTVFGGFGVGVGPDGYVNDPWGPQDDRENTPGVHFPSNYAPSSNYPIWIIALMGAFADSSGGIVGAPFKIGTQSLELDVPPGAASLLLGVNDDRYSDNSGSFQVAVTALTLVPPTITRHPLAQTASVGGAVSLSIEATGTPPLTYQWRKNGTAIRSRSRVLRYE